MTDYKYKCSCCGKEFGKELIEENFLYLCPECGLAERNQPLKGVMNIFYDYDELDSNLDRNKFLRLNAGNFSGYKDLLPVKHIDDDIRINLNPRIYNINHAGDTIKIFDDTLNPTLSLKDRASILACLKARELDIPDVCTSSTGNAGSSLAGISAILGLRSHVFVPSRIPISKRVQIQSYGSKIYIIDGTYDDAFDLCNEVASAKKWYNRNTAYNPLTIEGKKTAAYDIFISCSGEIPDSLFVPAGDGVIISGLYKGFYDLLELGFIGKIPHLIAVQAKGSNALVRFMESDKFIFNKTDTIADSIDAAAPRNLYMAVDSVRKTAGIALSVSDNEILEAQKYLAAHHGIFCEPSAASVFAAYLSIRNQGFESYYKNAMLCITGNGLKDTKALSDWNIVPEIYNYDEIRSQLMLK
ncbi:MAG: pyridoxal-phosphate dependent enzyme [Melioribacteraceae bacterium]|nr:pyridoxal-phosphate dependent enzyme [Melioribacteraceae bacterium]